MIDEKDGREMRKTKEDTTYMIGFGNFFLKPSTLNFPSRDDMHLRDNTCTLSLSLP